MNGMTYTITIPGTPIAKARPRVTRSGHAYTPQRTKDYENLVRQCFQIEHGSPMLEGALALELDLYFSIPKSTRKKDVPAMRTGQIRPTKRPDLDNCLKAVSDALNGVAYKDDSQIVAVVVQKFYGDEPRADIKITAWEETKS